MEYMHIWSTYTNIGISAPVQTGKKEWMCFVLLFPKNFGPARNEGRE